MGQVSPSLVEISQVASQAQQTHPTTKPHPSPPQHNTTPRTVRLLRRHQLRDVRPFHCQVWALRQVVRVQRLVHRRAVAARVEAVHHGRAQRARGRPAVDSDDPVRRRRGHPCWLCLGPMGLSSGLVRSIRTNEGPSAHERTQAIQGFSRRPKAWRARPNFNSDVDWLL